MVVIGVGNSLRHDDAAGLEVVRGVARRARTLADSAKIVVLEHEGEPLGLLERWQGARAAVLVDTTRSGARPGTVRRLDASADPIPAQLRSSASTHAVGVGEAIELARELGRMPTRVVVYGIEGARFDAGEGLSPEVQAVIGELAEAVLGEARALAAG